MHNEILILAIFAFLYSILAGRIEGGMVSGPIVFVSVGILMGPLVLGWIEGTVLRHQLRMFADMTLVLILFSDAANAELSVLRSKLKIPARMFMVGLPGVIVLGFGLALVLLDALSFYEAAILGVILAATDAALGKAVISDQRVPDWIRASLNAESGLNDGICVPFLFIFIALSLEAAGTAASTVAPLIIVLEEIGIGLIAGMGLTLVAATLLKFCISRGWLTEVWTQITVPALALACFELAGEMHGSGYIAAFTGGLLFGHLLGPSKHKFVVAAEGIGEALAMLTWLMFGSAVVAGIIGLVTWQIMVYALLSLTVVRVLPIVLSLTGTASTSQDRLFLGWFGPRGLASIVFVIIVLDSELPGGEVIALVVALTVFLSLIAHGVTAKPLSARISKQHSDTKD